jgi:hypothetical protein
VALRLRRRSVRDVELEVDDAAFSPQGADFFARDEQPRTGYVMMEGWTPDSRWPFAIAGIEAVGLVGLAASNRGLRVQNDLLRRQVEGEERDRIAARQADVRCVGGGRSGLGYSVVLTNIGPATAMHVKAWLASEDVKAVGSVEFQGPLIKDAKTPALHIPLSEAIIQEKPPLRLVVAWEDVEPRERVDEHEVRLS